MVWEGKQHKYGGGGGGGGKNWIQSNGQLNWPKIELCLDTLWLNDFTSQVSLRLFLRLL